jgi:hypothetical protein
VGKFTASITVSPACGYINQNLTVTMTLTNNYTNAIINVTPTALTVSTPGVMTQVSGPTPVPPNGPVPAGGTFSFTWGYQITGLTPGPTFTFSGTASGTEQTGGAGTLRNTPAAASNTATYGGFTLTVSPAGVNANSTNQELTWTVTNNGCADVKQVQITVPAGWGLPVTDSYSIVDQVNPPNPGANPIDPIENLWTVSGAGPIIFASPASPNYVLALIAGSAQDGSFSLVFPSTPSSAGTSNFTIRITDTNNAFADLTTGIPVNAFNTGSPNPNSNDTNAIREDIR